MLGLGRASQYAGWWGKVIPRINSVTTTSTANQGGLDTRPSYSADFSVGSAAQQQSLSVLRDATGSINMTGTGTTAKKQICSVTFQVGSNWMTTAPATYTDGYNQYFVYDYPTSQSSFRQMAFASEPGGANYVFGTGAGTNIYVNKTVFDANYRNKWLTCVFATSDSSADFANFAGGTDPYGQGWAARVRLFETQTMTPISSVYAVNGDGWLFDSTGSGPDLSQAWSFNDSSSSYNLNSFGYFAGDSTLYYRNDIKILSNWYTIGSTVDIGNSVYTNQLAGSAMSQTVNGITPWIAWAFNSAGTSSNGGNGINEWSNPVYTWGRIPASKVFIGVPAGQTSPDPAEFISL